MKTKKLNQFVSDCSVYSPPPLLSPLYTPVLHCFDFKVCLTCALHGVLQEAEHEQREKGSPANAQESIIEKEIRLQRERELELSRQREIILHLSKTKPEPPGWATISRPTCHTTTCGSDTTSKGTQSQPPLFCTC